MNKSINALLAKIAALPKPTRITLMMEPIAPKGLPRQAQELAKCGLVGAVPLAKYAGSSHAPVGWVALQLRPATAVDASPIVDVNRRVREGRTFAPDLSTLVAGRLADMSGMIRTIDGDESGVILDLAAHLGDRKAAPAVLAAGKKVKESVWDGLSVAEQRTVLYRAMGAVDPRFFVLAALQLYRYADNELRRKLSTVLRSVKRPPPKVAAMDEYHQLRAVGTIAGTADEVGKSAWRVIEGDLSCDMGPWGYHQLSSAVQRLDEQKRAVPKGRTKLVDAARAAAAKGEKYDGRLHLEAAQELAASEPALAVVQAINAASAHGRAKGRINSGAVGFAKRLAQRNGWTELATALEWVA